MLVEEAYRNLKAAAANEDTAVREVLLAYRRVQRQAAFVLSNSTSRATAEEHFLELLAAEQGLLSKWLELKRGTTTSKGEEIFGTLVEGGDSTTQPKQYLQ